jgi:hypothetical protein
MDPLVEYFVKKHGLSPEKAKEYAQRTREAKEDPKFVKALRHREGEMKLYADSIGMRDTVPLPDRDPAFYDPPPSYSAPSPGPGASYRPDTDVPGFTATPRLSGPARTPQEELTYKRWLLEQRDMYETPNPPPPAKWELDANKRAMHLMGIKAETGDREALLRYAQLLKERRGLLMRTPGEPLPQLAYGAGKEQGQE